MILNRLRRVVISGTGSHLPEKRITNRDLEGMVDTADEWIRQRTGIIERRLAAPEQATSDLALEAARRAVADADLAPADIDQLIVATVTPDHAFPSTACLVQHRLGCRQVPAFDLSAACSGFIYGLAVARTAIAAGTARHILVIGAETLTRFTDYGDRGTCILFGDGAGAAVLSRAEEADDDSGIIDTHLAADGSGAELMILPGGGSRLPPSPEMLAKRQNYIKLEGRAVYKNAISKIVMLVNESLERCRLNREDINLIIPHQMNARIIESAAKHLDIPLEKIFINLDRYGNTSAATIPIALDEARRENRLHKGDLVVLVAFGGGMTWASALLRW
ncbi:MAG: ketoacyl-ACP synthase III [Planctomycetota bacterium]|jgi:3-oxoacyl-[acyl-carrier-protein] synthase-3|nr:ketoacyl-ACP synthase III [Planctomycetota bacterium]